MKTILVVDDSKLSRNSVCDIVEGMGFESAQACDGRDASQLIPTLAELTLIITDFNMPNMNGLELTRWVKKSILNRDIPCVILTSLGTNNAEIIMEAREAGAIGVLKKPLSPEMLRKILLKLGIMSKKGA